MRRVGSEGFAYVGTLPQESSALRVGNLGWGGLPGSHNSSQTPPLTRALLLGNRWGSQNEAV